MLWLCLHLPNLALEVHTRSGPTPDPLVVSHRRGRESQVLIANAVAARHGIQPGMPLRAAHALVRGLRARARDAQAEQAALARLAAWAGQYTPLVSPVPPQTLLLEVAGSLTLFGGLDRLLLSVRAGLETLGYGAVLAVAPTPLAATWMAQAGAEARITACEQLPGALAVLPIDVLDLTDKQHATLMGMGIRQVGDCLRLPHDGLARRLGPAVGAAFDRALGRASDPRPPFIAPETFDARLSLPAPLADVEALLFPLHRLLFELAGFLTARAAGLRALTVVLYHAHATTTEIALTLVAPTRDARHLTALVRERFERVQLPEAVEEVGVRSTAPQPLAERNLDFFAPAHTAPEARAALVERLQARLGQGAVSGLCRVAEHRPERAWRYAEPGVADTPIECGQRPLWLLPEPLPLAQYADEPYLDGVLVLECDRERIESGWWDGHDVTRDYFIAVNPRGARFWIFRELSGARRWFVHGIFG